MLRNIFTEQKLSITPNRYDILALLLVFVLIIFLGWNALQMSMPYHIGDTLPLSLSPTALPHYVMQTVMRMLIALLCSLLFTFTVGTWAAKSAAAGKLIIPLLDILQSVPVLAFQAIAIVPFIRLFSGSLWGPECAAIFAIFTAQVWNMTLGFYQTVSTVPHNLREASHMFHLSAWQRFWRIEVPFSMPGLLWNTMMSMSASWFFVVAAEAISVSGQNILLPGLGSYIAVAIQKANVHAVIYAIFTMLFVILLYDQILFRPLVKWAEKFKAEETPPEEETYSWFTNLLQRSRVITGIGNLLATFGNAFINTPLFQRKPERKPPSTRPLVAKSMKFLGNSLLFLIVALTIVILYQFIFHHVPLSEASYVFLLGLYTTIRVVILIIACSLLWVPVGVWVGAHPRIAQWVQPIAQILAAFPANLLFPLVVILIIRYHLNVEIWTTPLMILGTQWYVLFNVIAGTTAIPKEMIYAANNFGVKGWLWWKKVILPGVFPYYITGAISAAGGAWNASIVAEVVNWGHTTLRATGLGAYIAESTTSGDFPRIALGIGVMCTYVLLLNHTIWRPLYNLAIRRYQMDA